MYPLQDLATLVAIADAGSVRGAAAILGRTQPAVSQAIRRLESSVGFELIDRTSYRARLTERGELFVRRARPAVQQARDLRAYATLLERGTEPRLRIACHGAVPESGWLDIARDVATSFPETRLEIQVGEGNAPMRQLLSGEAQFAIILQVAPEQLATQVDALQPGHVEFVTAVRTDLLQELRTDQPSLPQILVADFDDPSSAFGVVDAARTMRVSTHRIKATMIRKGLGWGSLPATLIEEDMKSGEVSAVAHKGFGQRSRHAFYMCRTRSNAKGPVAAHVWQLAQRLREDSAQP